MERKVPFDLLIWHHANTEESHPQHLSAAAVNLELDLIARYRARMVVPDAAG